MYSPFISDAPGRKQPSFILRETLGGSSETSCESRKKKPRKRSSRWDCRSRNRVLEAHEARVAGTAVSIPGQVNPFEGRVLTAPGLGIDWNDVNLSEEFQALPPPLYVDNDARASTLAEMYYGRAKGVEHLVVVQLCSGVGAGFVLGGRLYEGYRQISGEFGHQTVNLHGRRAMVPMRQSGMPGGLRIRDESGAGGDGHRGTGGGYVNSLEGFGEEPHRPRYLRSGF